jgi:hypothetical protein
VNDVPLLVCPWCGTEFDVLRGSWHTALIKDMTNARMEGPDKYWHAEYRVRHTGHRCDKGVL